jgi:hypothetical protein
VRVLADRAYVCRHMYVCMYVCMYESAYIYYDSVLMYVKGKTLPRLNAAVAFRKVRVKSNFSHVGSEGAYGQLHMYTQHNTTQHNTTQHNTVEIQTLKHWNLIGRNTTTPPPSLSPSSILLPLSSHSTFISSKQKFASRLKMLFFSFLPF